MLERDKQMLADHYLDLYRTAYALLKNESDVEDAVQEALAQTMSHVWVNNPYNYCIKVLQNYCYRLLSRKIEILTDNLPEQPIEKGIDENRLQQLTELKEQLPKRIQDILDMYYVKGYTKAMIVEETGMSMSMVKKLIHKGHSRLRQQMIETDKNNNDIFFDHEPY